LNLVIIKLGFSLPPLGARASSKLMIVCHCRGVTDREIRRCVRAGEKTVGAVSEACGAATGCGGCRPLVSKIVESEVEAQGCMRLPVLQAAALISA
jgi:NAD(P)H-nitrite reductase large subunit